MRSKLIGVFGSKAIHLIMMGHKSTHMPPIGLNPNLLKSDLVVKVAGDTMRQSPERSDREGYTSNGFPHHDLRRMRAKKSVSYRCRETYIERLT